MSNNEKFLCNKLILTNGTFLNGLLHIGDKKIPAGRMGEVRSEGITEALTDLGLKSGRLKTGTPPRLYKKSIDWKLLHSIDGDALPIPFSHFHTSFAPTNEPSFAASTNPLVHETIWENINLSPMYSGDILGVGPRYCPSIEDKINRFKGRDSHRLICEPEWKNSDQIYLNGFSTSLPESVQLKALRKVKGFNNVELVKPGYAIEYDYFYPNQLKRTLEAKHITGLYLAGQINGTSGYEEAAIQGLIAGANAALSTKNLKPLVLSRSEAYGGVLIDDLTTKSTPEPYRMFTSRAEYRLTLRADNADQRLTDLGIDLDLIKDERKNFFLEKKKNILSVKTILDKNNLTPNEAKKHNIKIAMDGVKRSCMEVIGQRNVNMAKIRQIFSGIPDYGMSIDNQVEIDAHYMGYLQRQSKDISSFKKDESVVIPESINYDTLSGLSNEIKSKLIKVKPKTLGQAIRIDGVTPAAIIILLSHIKKLRYKASA